MAAIHHYVPRFLLKRFCSGDKPRIWGYDKQTGKSFQTNVENVAGERNFYQLEIGEDTLSLEDGLSEYESRAALLIERIVAERDIGWLSEESRNTLASFVALQMKRGPHTRENFVAMDQGFRKVLGERFGVSVDGLPEMTSERAKQLALTSLAEPDQYAEHILSKTWLLFETDDAAPFYLSDNPVALQNEEPERSPLQGNLGLAVKGIQIYLPISSTLMLGFFCRSHEAMIRASVDRVRTTIVRDAGFQVDFGPLLNWMRAFRTGTPLRATSQNVLNQRSLQVIHAERYVFSSVPDFALVEDMIERDQDIRSGPRIEFG
jgi:hypothetical protein